MKPQNYNWSYSNESSDESNREFWEGYPVYPGSEDIYDLELGQSRVYGFSDDNQILWMKQLGVTN